MPRTRKTVSLKDAATNPGAKVVGERIARPELNPDVAPDDLGRAREIAARHGLEIVLRVHAGGNRHGVTGRRSRSGAFEEASDTGARPDVSCVSFKRGRWVLVDWYPATERAFMGGATGGRAAAKKAGNLFAALNLALGCE